MNKKSWSGICTNKNEEFVGSMGRAPEVIANQGATKDLSDFTERRMSPRYPVSLPLEYWKMNDSECRGGLAANISETGLLVLSTHRMGIGKSLKITVMFPNGYELNKFDVLATVIWQGRHTEMYWTGYKCGVKFVLMSEKDRAKLDHFLTAHLSAHLSANEVLNVNSPAPSA
jgi:hypothetical protein